MTFEWTFARRALIGLTVAAVAGIAAAQAADDPANAIKYRKMVMGALGAHIGAISSVVKGEVSHGAHVPAHAKALYATSLMLPDIFPEGSDMGDTRAKPVIWQEWDKFQGRIKDLNAAAEKLSQIAESGDMAAVGAQLKEVGEACGGCHKPYREEKK